MLNAPLLKSSGLHISVFQDRSERGVFNKMFEKVQKLEKKVNNVKLRLVGIYKYLSER